MFKVWFRVWFREGGTAGARIRLGVSGWGGGPGFWVLGWDPYHLGGGGGRGSNTEHGTIYMYIIYCLYIA